MKNKVLLSTLLGGALLAGCTADDALDVKKDVAKGVNPAAPVFTISFGGDDITRATVGSTGLNWERTDKMSLYHGGGAVSGTGTAWSVSKNEDTDDFLAEGQVRKFDAIYSGSEDGEDFTTQSMVTEGLAIMIYPADTAYVQTDKNPHILLTNEQDENTVTKLPYVSEMMVITEHGDMDIENGENLHSAGFGRKYDLRMRPIGSILTLTVNGGSDERLTAAGIADPEIRKMKIEVEPAADNKALPFTTEMWVKIGQERRNEGKTGGSELVGTNTADHGYWKYSPWIEPVNENEKIGTLAPRTNWISTTHIENNNVAYFALLPYEDRPDVDVVIEETGDEDNKILEAKYGDVTITVETEYGKVTMTSTGDEEEDQLWSNGGGTATYNIKDGLTYALKTLFAPATKSNPLYEGQLVGKRMNHKLTIDLSELDMNNLHIRDQKNLNTVLDVYKALEKTEAVRFILDGDDEGKFYMNEATWKRVAELMADEDNKITFAACNDEKPCTTIVLENNGTVDVPSLVFDNKNYNADKIQPYVTIELADNTIWTFSATQEDAQVMTKVKYLVVDEFATLNLKNTTINVANGLKVGTNDFELVNYGTVNIAGDVYLMNKMTNHGRIYIPKTSESVENRFLMYNGGELTNSEDAVYNRNFEEGWWTLTPETATSVLKNAGGVIDNHGTLAIVTGSGGTISNYGTINIWETNARTLITTNQDVNPDIQKPYSKTNRFGTINLQKSGVGINNLTIQSSKNGFVKYATSIITASSGLSSLANYVVVDTKVAIPSKTYIEIQYDEEELEISAALSPEALIIPKGRSLFLPNTNSASLAVSKYLYLKGSITHAKNVTGSYQFTGYFGGDANKDKDNLFSAY